MRVIFLDIDGVLNSWQSIYFEHRHKLRASQESLCPIAMSNLDEILLVCPDVQIVISSTWRKYFSIDELKRIMTKQGFKSADRIIGYTPTNIGKFSEYVERLLEIRAYLAEHPEITRYVIIDDNTVSETEQSFPDFVQTDGRVGLDWFAADKVRSLFGGKEFGGCFL